MKESCLIDSSFLIKVILEKKGELLTSLYRNYYLFVPINVLEESFYIILHEISSEYINSHKFSKIKSSWSKREPRLIDEVKKRISIINELIEKEIIFTLPLDLATFELSKNIAYKYGLLPNDALIAAACKRYGIKYIATFDDDFKKVEFLKIVKLED